MGRRQAQRETMRWRSEENPDNTTGKIPIRPLLRDEEVTNTKRMMANELKRPPLRAGGC